MTRESFDKIVTYAGLTPDDEFWAKFSEGSPAYKLQFIMELVAITEPPPCQCKCECDRCDPDEEV